MCENAKVGAMCRLRSRGDARSEMRRCEDAKMRRCEDAKKATLRGVLDS